MTLQELLKNDEDKRSHHAAKSGERLVGPADGADSDSSAPAADMFIKAEVTTVSESAGRTDQRHQTCISFFVKLPQPIWKVFRGIEAGIC